MNKIERLAFVINATKSGAVELADLLAAVAQNHGVTVRMTQDYPIEAGFLEGQDACCVVGGDGTLLSVVPESVSWNIPVFGINRGKLGFLATYSVQEAQDEFENILQGDYCIVNRSILECDTKDGERSLALNDAVIKSADVSRLIGLRVKCGDDLVTDYYSDGIIFSTPTGSTAYNLSSGGPIVMPDASVLTMTPVCPHTLTNRSLVFSGNTELSVELLESAGNPFLTLDGSQRFHGEHHFPFKIKICKKALPLLQPHTYSHFRILRKKLKWGNAEDSNS
ncbi:NAD(+)/NADH kinase [Rubellicoccus peritrichatus]|uniref:NAD kinase n=1 Tax=Rubellicoccus peritrichatus TaxID=3080537 RepID=A0AAQ3LFD9_9BACT|nr:NAD(+)/NADH kinase [Puniceicoccus sp. CR14]WOO43539.1 NAD(+)/NADH kinase [Puniceicoccus sp. CR14]